jgi:hypothetical protein
MTLARASIGHPRVVFVRHDREQFRDPGLALRRNDAELSQVRSKALMLCAVLRQLSLLFGHCSVDLICTNRIVGRREPTRLRRGHRIQLGRGRTHPDQTRARGACGVPLWEDE